jgi:dTMP kinase
MNPSGLLISIEGLPISGKTKQVLNLFNWLCDNELECIACKTPGGTTLGREVKHLLYGRPDLRKGLNPFSETFLMLADIAQLYEETVLPCLNHNKFIVVQEGGISTLLALQSVNPDGDMFIAPNSVLAVQGRKPDLTIFLDCTVPTAQKRAQHYAYPYHYTGTELQIMRDSFFVQVQENPQTMRYVNGENEPEAVIEDILFIIKPLLRERQYID